MGMGPEACPAYQIHVYQAWRQRESVVGRHRLGTTEPARRAEQGLGHQLVVRAPENGLAQSQDLVPAAFTCTCPLLHFFLVVSSMSLLERPLPIITGARQGKLWDPASGHLYWSHLGIGIGHWHSSSSNGLKRDSAHRPVESFLTKVITFPMAGGRVAMCTVHGIPGASQNGGAIDVPSPGPLEVDGDYTPKAAEWGTDHHRGMLTTGTTFGDPSDPLQRCLKPLISCSLLKALVCKKNPDSTTVAVHGEEIYCMSCYGKNYGPTEKKYGPKDYGYGQGAGTLSTNKGESLGIKKEEAPGHRPTTNPNASQFAQKINGSELCHCCSQAVCAAEKFIGAGKSWQKSCFPCAKCGKGLKSTTLADKDGEIYCKGCYTKNFGPKGFGFGQGAGALVHSE
ncbi:PREDICTED: uncharacterized protein LOC102837231 [Chrysochloris asiatica]|uniref:Cysteine and glycine-rich protein 1 n=1 Tax=Chrysochloris asiatica TaxID=185453 RepID=A0A9B0TQL7_CHRAS|nr:PREDICTED: uncharacterized protein LOC102837231 [Chrysochloris asiatica]